MTCELGQPARARRPPPPALPPPPTHQGALLGPILLSLLTAFYNLHVEFLNPGHAAAAAASAPDVAGQPLSPRVRITLPSTHGLGRVSASGLRVNVPSPPTSPWVARQGAAAATRARAAGTQATADAQEASLASMEGCESVSLRGQHQQQGEAGSSACGGGEDEAQSRLADDDAAGSFSFARRNE